MEEDRPATLLYGLIKSTRNQKSLTLLSDHTTTLFAFLGHLRRNNPFLFEPEATEAQTAAL